MSDNIPLNERIIVALDVTEKEQAKELVKNANPTPHILRLVYSFL